MKLTELEQEAVDSWKTWWESTTATEVPYCDDSNWHDMAIGWLLGKGVANDRAPEIASYMAYTLHIV